MTDNIGIAVIGAGKTGRGFIGRLIQESGLGFYMIDRNRELIDQLREAGRYEVGFFGATREPVRVTDYVATHADDPRLDDILKDVRLIFISVGGTHITEVAQWLAHRYSTRISDGIGRSSIGEGIDASSIGDAVGKCDTDEKTGECSVILCENASNPALVFKQAFLAALKEEERSKAGMLFGFSEATVFCTTIEHNRNQLDIQTKDNRFQLDIQSEDHPNLQCSAETLKSNLPSIKGLMPIKDFENFLIRKIYTYNAASAAISYLGWLKGYSVYSYAANDPEILLLLDQLYLEVGKAMCAEYGYEAEEQREFAARSLVKFRNRTIQDTIARNTREPHRKLAFNERIIGPALLIQKYGGDVGPLATTAAAALLYEDANDLEWNTLQKENSPAGILEKVSGLLQASELTMLIMDKYEELKKRKRNSPV